MSPSGTGWAFIEAVQRSAAVLCLPDLKPAQQAEADLSADLTYYTYPSNVYYRPEISSFLLG